MRKQGAQRDCKLSPGTLASTGPGIELQLRTDQRVRGAARVGAGAEGCGVDRRTVELARAFGAAGGAGAERDSLAGIPAHSHAGAVTVAQEHFDARPLHVSVLPQD